MKTNDLIAAIAADQLPDARPVEHTIKVAAVLGGLVSLTVFLLSMGWRPDIGAALVTVRFPFKFIVTLAVVISAAQMLVRLAKPDADVVRGAWRLGAGPALILAGVVVELLVLPSSAWRDNLVGSNAALCLMAIPFLSIAPTVALLLALKRGAPARPRLAGAVCGLLSASIAATMYALHCTDDSPLFVFVWYSSAIGIVTVVAAVAGGRLLRW